MSRLRAAGIASAGAILAFASLAGCGDGGSKLSAAPRAPRPVRITTATATARRLTYTVEANGSLEAYQVVTVPARLAGTLEKVAFEEGQSVTPDTILAIIDGERHRLEVAEADAAVTRADANLIKADASVTRMQAQIDGAASSLADAQANLARREALNVKAPGSVMAEDLASAKTMVARMKAALDEATAAKGEAAAARGESVATIGNAKAHLALVKKTQSDSEIRSPISGIVQTKSVSAGQYVKEGAAIAVLVDTSSLRLRFRVTEGESVRLAIGPHVDFVAQALPQRTFKAELFHVNATADDQTRMVECLATVIDPDPSLKPGFFARVVVETGRSAASITVDENAILASEVGFSVFVVEDGKGRRRPVARGLLTKDGQREILSGLAVGDVVVVQGALALQDGMAVEEAPAGQSPPTGSTPPAGMASPEAPPPPMPAGGVK